MFRCRPAGEATDRDQRGGGGPCLVAAMAASSPAAAFAVLFPVVAMAAVLPASTAAPAVTGRSFIAPVHRSIMRWALMPPVAALFVLSSGGSGSSGGVVLGSGCRVGVSRRVLRRATRGDLGARASCHGQGL